MTEKQQRWFNAILWPAACRAQGWRAGDRPFKLEKVGTIIGRAITTTKDVHWDREFDVLRRELESLAAPDNLARARAAVAAGTDDQRSRWLHKLAEFDRPLVLKLTRDFSRGTIVDPAELPDRLLKAVVVTCEQIKRGVRYPVKRGNARTSNNEHRTENSELSEFKAQGSGVQSSGVAEPDPFTTGQTPF